MPEHDLLMQLNEKINNLCTAIGRIEEKVDNVTNARDTDCEVMQALNQRVSFLEQCRMYDKGIIAAIAAVISIIITWVKT
jgi:hypothetical protein